jgi:hypothetical protein
VFGREAGRKFDLPVVRLHKRFVPYAAPFLARQTFFAASLVPDTKVPTFWYSNPDRRVTDIRIALGEHKDQYWTSGVRQWSSKRDQSRYGLEKESGPAAS